MNRIHRLSYAVFCVLISTLLAFPAGAAQNSKPRKAKIKAVTYNLYVGADIFRVFDPPPCGTAQAVHDIHRIIEYTNFPERAEAIADQIMMQEPHVVGLQEVSLLRTQFPGNALAPDGSGIEFLGDFPVDPRFTFKQDAEDVQYDFLQILLDALAARGLDYVAVDDASPVNADVEFPAIEFDSGCTPLGAPTDVRLTDRDVILVRSNLDVTLALESNFQINAPIELPTFIPTPGGPVPAVYVTEFTRGWGAIDVTIKDQSFRVINTHLEVGDRSLPPSEGLNLVQGAQALELGYLAMALQPPVLVLGDLNSSPASLVTDPRPAYALLSGFALSDVWTLRHPASDDPGYTFGQNETVDNPDSLMFERIDHVFVNFGDLDPKQIKAEVLGKDPADRTPSGLWPSDHAGVGVKLGFER